MELGLNHRCGSATGREAKNASIEPEGSRQQQFEGLGFITLKPENPKPSIGFRELNLGAYRKDGAKRLHGAGVAGDPVQSAA